MIGLHFLPRCLSVQINRNESIKNIRNPDGKGGTEVAVDGEGRSDGRKENVGKAQSQSDTDV